MPWPPVIGIGLLVVLLPFIIYELGLAAIGIGTGNEGLIALGVTAIWMALGLAVYYGYSKQQEAEKLEEETPTVVTEQAPSNADQQLVVPIANPENANQLMRTAIDIVEDRGGEILVMSVVTVPQQTPLSEGRRFISDEREVLNEAMEIAETEDVPVSGTIRIGHSVSQAILNTINQYGSDAVLMGWKGQRKSQRRDIVLGSNVDTVAQEADADVLVERLGRDATGEAETILLPTAGGPHAEFAAEIASAITDNDRSRVDVVHVVDPGADENERQAAQELLASTESHIEDAGEITTQILEGDDVVETIVDESDGYDMTLVGATREGLLTQLVFGSVPEQIGWNANSTVLMAKRHLGITSLIERWL